MEQLNTRIVLRNDSSANWLANEEQILLKGEVGVEFLEEGKTRIKIGDGETPWKNLEYFNVEHPRANVIQVQPDVTVDDITAINNEASGMELYVGDIAIVKRLVTTADVDGKERYQYTAYVYNGTVWAAMDGNYNAKNVYFDQDFIFTTKIGTVQTLTNGSATVDAEGKNMYEFFAGLFAKEANPSKTEPSVKTLTLNKAGEYEAGTIVTGVTYSAVFDAGSYSYGPTPTGVEVTAWEVTDADGNIVGTAATGHLDDVDVSDETNYYVTAKATYSAGVYGKTNLGNDSTVRIGAGNKSKTSGAIKGYRNTFYGTFDDLETALTSTNIRKLTASGKTLSAGDKFKIEIPTSAVRAVIAVPSGLEISSVTHEEGLGAPVLGTFKSQSVLVQGADERDAIYYDVYVAEFNNFSATNHYDVTI